MQVLRNKNLWWLIGCRISVSRKHCHFLGLETIVLPFFACAKNPSATLRTRSTKKTQPILIRQQLSAEHFLGQNRRGEPELPRTLSVVYNTRRNEVFMLKTPMPIAVTKHSLRTCLSPKRLGQKIYPSDHSHIRGRERRTEQNFPAPYFSPN